MLGAAASVGKTTGSALIINSFFGTMLNASFGIANRLNGFIMMFARNLGQAAIPQIVKSHSGGDSKRTLNLVAYVSKYSFMLMLLPALPILLETEYLLKLWLGDIPEYTVWFTKLMIINGLVDSFMAGVPAAIQATGKIKWFQIIMSTILLISLPIAYFMFKLGFSPYYIQIIYICSSLINTIVAIILLKRLINFDVKFLIKTSYLRIMLISILVSPLFVLHNFFSESFTRFVITVVISIMYYFLILYLVGFDNKEKELINKTIKSFKNKIKKGK